MFSFTAFLCWWIVSLSKASTTELEGMIKGLSLNGIVWLCDNTAVRGGGNIFKEAPYGTAMAWSKPFPGSWNAMRNSSVVVCYDRLPNVTKMQLHDHAKMLGITGDVVIITEDNSLRLCTGANQRVYYFNPVSRDISENYVLVDTCVTNELGSLEPSSTGLALLVKIKSEFLERRSNFKGVNLKLTLATEMPFIQTNSERVLRAKAAREVEDIVVSDSELFGPYISIGDMMSKKMNWTATRHR